MSDLTNAEKRDAFIAGAQMARCHGGMDNDHIEKVARLRYPDPYEPKVAVESTGIERRICEDGRVQWRRDLLCPWIADDFTPSDFMAHGEIAQEYYERTK